ncbi:MAG: winged helix DNA-binding protein [Hyphomicrobiales bacterium]|nr:winged helix DNA-binding protein [Hyphomicrobiales bacterium]
MSVVLDYSSTETTQEASPLMSQYLMSLKIVERLHRLLLDVVKAEFEREGRNDVNGVQALLLYNIGDTELTAGEIRTRGYYLGSNVSYNLKKLVDSGYIHHQRSKTDRRSVRVRLTPKGKDVYNIVSGLFERQLTMIEKVAGLSLNDLKAMNEHLSRLERFWGDQIRYRL